jgi:hypothetical protein
MLKKITIVFLLSIITTLAFAAEKDVIVLYNGATKLNRELINFINKEIRQVNTSYKLKLTQNSSDIKPGVYKAVVVLSTGYDTGTDPKLAKFISDYGNKKEVILLVFKNNTSTLFVQYTPSKKSVAGVDAITSATAWERSGRGQKTELPKSGDGVIVSTYDSPIAMHEAWLGKLIELIDAM